MSHLRFTLITDGSSDRALIPVLTWLLREHLSDYTFEPQWPDLRLLLHPPQTLAARIRTALSLAPCDILFVHRDAEREPMQRRVTEIRQALQEVDEPPLFFCVVPVRMLEAWFLADERAIRAAAGNPNGTVLLELPPLHTLEQLPDPKSVLDGLLRRASGLNDRSWRKRSGTAKVERVAELIDDFTPLRRLPAFAALENEVQQWAMEQLL